jgi:hypothetical protein
MKKMLLIRNLFCLTLFLVFLSGSTLYAQKKSKSKQKEAPVAEGLKLEYNYPADKSFRYVTDSKIIQDMDINGQSMLVNVATFMGCDVKSAGRQGNNLKLVVKLDSMSQFVDSPQGSAGGGISSLKGKTFNIVISPAGKAEDISEATAVVYTIEGSGESNMAEAFNSFFPALPENPVKPGDTWVVNDTIESKSPTNSMHSPFTSNYKFEGVETINGIECAKISATVSGTRKISTQAQGMDILTNGTFTGTMNILFAVKEGYFVKDSLSSKMTGEIEVVGQGMTFPMVMDITEVKKIAK